MKRAPLRVLFLLAILLPTGVVSEPMEAALGQVTVRADALEHDSAKDLYRAEIVFPPAPSRRQLLAGEDRGTAVSRLLSRIVAMGAAGNHGDLYDNRDRGHSSLERRHWPTLTFVDYDQAARDAGLDYGLNLRLSFSAITIGNSSTAIIRRGVSRSLPRAAMTTAGGMTRLQHLYETNHIYIYPAHKDFGNGVDRFPANTAQIVISQGASHSDRLFLEASASMLAALRPETKAFLREAGLVAPTFQMLLRRSMAGIVDDSDYLSSAAHPVAFLGRDIDLESLINRASALTPDLVPPMVRLSVTSETRLTDGMDIFGDDLSETLYETPTAIAKTFQGVPQQRVFHLSTAGTRDPNGQPLSFVWRVLRGSGIEIRSMTAEAREVEIIVPWQDAYTDPSTGMETRRADIAVFASNGNTFSAPSFFSVVFPYQETRRYSNDGQPLSIDYGAMGRGRVPRDPLIFADRRWRDTYRYDDHGRLLGWTRTRANDVETDFDRFGRRVIAKDSLGRPLATQAVRYPVRSYRASHNDRMGVDEELGDWVWSYHYDGPEDRLGRVSFPSFLLSAPPQ